MGNRSTKSSLRNAIVFLNISADSIEINDDKFWNQIWNEDCNVAANVIKGISLQEIRILRDGSAKNFALLTYKMVERLHSTTGTLCNTLSQQTAALNAIRILTRLIPCIYEDKKWNSFFLDNCINCDSIDKLKFPKKEANERDYTTYIPFSREASRGSFENYEEQEEEEVYLSQTKDDKNPNASQPQLVLLNIETSKSIDEITQSHDEQANYTNIESNDTLMRNLILSICDLLFCPEFTVAPLNDNFLSSSVDAPPEDLKSLITCEYVWEPGIGFDSNVNSTRYYDKSRIELLRLLLTCLSTSLYETPKCSTMKKNICIELFASHQNRHALPLFTSILNTIFTYKPSKVLPFKYSLFEDSREELVELCLQVLIVTLDCQFEGSSVDKSDTDKRNLFVEYLSRIHRDEDYTFLFKGFARLLNNCLEQNYLLNSTRNINFEQELLILFWRIANYNSKFVNNLLKTNDILDIVVPILHHLNENFQNSKKTALIHVGVFNLLILSGERNFGVRLNKPYLANVLINLPTFTGSHADLLIIVCHKLILYGYNINQLFDYLLTIIVNISPYVKVLSMLASKCLIQLFEIFSSPYVIFTEPNYHKLVVFLLEIFNNLVQYQFDGNANVVYAILNKKELFINLANLPSTTAGIEKILNKLVKKKQRQRMLENSAACGKNDINEINNNEIVKTGNSHPTQQSAIRLGATVSSKSSSRQDVQETNRDVTLVATPDICQVTLETHPFISSGTGPRVEVNESSNSPSSYPTISFDDLMDQTSINEESTSSCANDERDLEEDHQKLSPTSEDLTKKNSPIDDLSGNSSCSSPVNACPKWKPTAAWVKRWKQMLPLHTIIRMIEVLSPQLDRSDQDNKNQRDELEAIKFLQNGTLVGLLPVPHPILMRKYKINEATTLWFRACTWGTIYVRSGIWTDTAIRLIKIV